MAMYEKSYTTEDDYIESGGVFAELTVTISLCEYRRLVSDDIFLRTEIKRLEKENEKLAAQIKTLGGALLAKSPDLLNKIAAVADALIDSVNNEEENDEA